MPVRVAPPGRSALTVTPVPSSSCDQMIVSDSSAALEGPYGEKPFRRMVWWFMEMLTTRPQPRSSIPGTTARAMKNGPFTLVAITISHVSALVSQKLVGSVMKRSETKRIPRPALLTRMSTGPRR